MSLDKWGLRFLALIGLHFLLASCTFVGVEDPSASAILPPAQPKPTGLVATRELSNRVYAPAVAEVAPPVSSEMPTAIARTIAEAFPTAAATESPNVRPTTVPAPTVTEQICAEPGTIVTGIFPSEIAGNSPYRIYLPPCYGQGERVYPTLYMLPGNIHTDSVWDDLGLDDAAEAAIKRGDIPPLLIVMAPGGNLSNFTSGGEWSYESMIMDELIPYIEEQYCAWREPAGRAIGGMSRGGYWSLEIAFRHADQFASVGGHSASLYDLYGGTDVVPQSTGLVNDLGDLRIYFDVGENDWVIPNIKQLHEDMEAAGIEHTWVINEGWHENAYWAAHTGEYITWYSEPWPLERTAYPACSPKVAESSP